MQERKDILPDFSGAFKGERVINTAFAYYGYSEQRFREGFCGCPQYESNIHCSLRTGPFYPLNYGGRRKKIRGP